MLMSAGLPLPRKVWVHGWLLAQGERMSKSRGNFLDPIDVVAALGRDGARYVTLREVAFDQDSDVSWDSFVRRYNADLANDLGNLLNRTLSMTSRYLDGERPAAAPGGALGAAVAATILAAYARARSRAACSTRRSQRCGASWAPPTATWTRSSPGSSPRPPRPATRRPRRASGMSSATCSRPAGSSRLAAAPFMPDAAARILEQLGHAFPYGPDGNGGPALAELAAWGALGGAGPASWRRAVPLFPRQEVEPPEAGIAPEVSTLSSPRMSPRPRVNAESSQVPMDVLMVSLPWAASPTLVEPEHVPELVGRHRAHDRRRRSSRAADVPTRSTSLVEQHVRLDRATEPRERIGVGRAGQAQDARRQVAEARPRSGRPGLPQPRVAADARPARRSGPGSSPWRSTESDVHSRCATR